MHQGEKNDRHDDPDAILLTLLISSIDGMGKFSISHMALNEQMVKAAKLEAELAIPAECGKLFRDFMQKNFPQPVSCFM
jgi:hypothetical protein